ncbi:MAG: hypothetical protein ACYC65_04475 [Candidatus Limnocylindrales bacterium]
MDQLSEPLSDLLFLGLDHGVDSVRGGGPLIPFVIVEGPEGRSLKRFVAGTPEAIDLEGSVRQAVEHARDQVRQDGSRLVLVYDAYLRLGEERFDAVYAEVVEHGSVQAVIAQRYRPKGRLRRFETIGNPGQLPVGMGMLGTALSA